jgi:hypothetical protein
MLYDRYGNRTAENPPTEVPAAHPAEARTPITSPAALYALYYMVGDHQLVDRLVHHFPTWEALASAGPLGLAYAAGPWAAQLRVPTDAPQPGVLPDGITAHSRYEEANYPSQLRNLADAPVLLYQIGQIPTTPMLAIGGTYYPSQSGVNAVVEAVKAAVAQDVPIVAALDSGCGHMALHEAVNRGGRVLAVSSCDLANPASNALLFRRILDSGGGVVSEWGPAEPWSEARTFSSARLVAALSSGVVLAELGTHPAGGAHLARAAIATGRYLIVPTPDQNTTLPVTADGTVALADPRAFTKKLYGDHPRIKQRVKDGQPAADAVVSTPDELSAAVRTACGQPLRRSA